MVDQAKLYLHIRDYLVKKNGLWTVEAIYKYLIANYSHLYRRIKKVEMSKVIEAAMQAVSNEVKEGSETSSEVERLEPTEKEGNHMNQSLRKKYNPSEGNGKKRKLNSVKHDSVKRLAMSPSHVIPISPEETYKDLGGITACIQEVIELIEYPIRHPEIYAHLGIESPTGILLHGPPGCGKTLLAHAIAGELEIPLLKIAGPEIVSGVSGESESKLREFFQAGIANAPCILFMDELDAIAEKRGTTNRGMDVRLVAQLLSSIDQLNRFKKSGKSVVVIGATNRKDSIDPALRRAGRFDREISMGIPNEVARLHILRTITRGMHIASNIDFRMLAQNTPGYVGADLKALAKEAAVIAVNRVITMVLPGGDGDGAVEIIDPPITNEDDELDDEKLCARLAASRRLRNSRPLTPQELGDVCIEKEDFVEALSKVQPSAKREGFTTIPDVTWEHVGALQDIREELNLSVIQPVRNQALFHQLGIHAPAGLLLYGPPGVGKTLLAKALANECGFNFISVKGPELINKFVGESERAVRTVFERGKASKPCIIFFDEIDSLCPRREGSATSASSERVVNQLLTELDGLDDRNAVYVIGATNRPDIMDPAMLRPGRLGKLVFVPLPKGPDRVAILQTLCRNIPLDDGVCLESMGMDQRLERFSGADLASLVHEASLLAARDILQGESTSLHWRMNDDLVKVHVKHFQEALSKVRASVSIADTARYEKLRKQFSYQ